MSSVCQKIAIRCHNEIAADLVEPWIAAAIAPLPKAAIQPDGAVRRDQIWIDADALDYWDVTCIVRLVNQSDADAFVAALDARLDEPDLAGDIKSATIAEHQCDLGACGAETLVLDR